MSTRSRAAAVLRHVVSAPVVPSVPEGRMVELPGRGSTYLVDAPGPEGAPTVVLLHAIGCTGYLSWYPVLADLQQHYRVLVFDQRWHGRGIRSSHFHLRDCADDVAAVLDVAGVDRAIPVGYSMGGLIGQLVAKQHPDRLEGLVLCSTARNFRGKRREQFFFPLVSTAMMPLNPVARGRVHRAGEALPPLPSFDPMGKGWGLTEFRSTSAWSMPAVLNELGRFNSAPWIGDVRVPTSVLVTTKDKAIPSHRQRKLAESIPGAEVVEVHGGHVSLVLKAEQFKHALLAGLGSVTQRSRRSKAAAG